MNQNLLSKIEKKWREDLKSYQPYVVIEEKESLTLFNTDIYKTSEEGEFPTITCSVNTEQVGFKFRLFAEYFLLRDIKWVLNNSYNKALKSYEVKLNEEAYKLLKKLRLKVHNTFLGTPLKKFARQKAGLLYQRVLNPDIASRAIRMAGRTADSRQYDWIKSNLSQADYLIEHYPGAFAFFLTHELAHSDPFTKEPSLSKELVIEFGRRVLGSEGYSPEQINNILTMPANYARLVTFTRQNYPDDKEDRQLLYHLKEKSTHFFVFAFLRKELLSQDSPIHDLSVLATTPPATKPKAYVEKLKELFIHLKAWHNNRDLAGLFYTRKWIEEVYPSKVDELFKQLTSHGTN